MSCGNAYHRFGDRVNRTAPLADDKRRGDGVLLGAGMEAMQPFETIYIDSQVAACNGGGGPLGHPKVYLNLSADGKIECPYCSRLFVRRPSGAAAGTGSGAGAGAAEAYAPPAAPAKL